MIGHKCGIVAIPVGDAGIVGSAERSKPHAPVVGNAMSFHSTINRSVELYIGGKMRMQKVGTMATVYDVQKRIGEDEWLTIFSTYNLRDARTEAKYERKFKEQTTRVMVRMEEVNA